MLIIVAVFGSDELHAKSVNVFANEGDTSHVVVTATPNSASIGRERTLEFRSNSQWQATEIPPSSPP